MDVHWTTRADLAAARANPDAAPPIPARLDRDEAQARDRLLGQPKARARMVGALGVLHQWRTAAASQVARALGDPPLANPNHAVWVDLLATGLVERGVPLGGLRTRVSLVSAPVVLHRPGRRDAYEKIEEHLAYAEKTAITGGKTWQAYRQYARHNTLATELGLRAVEAGIVPLALGEQWASHDALAFAGLGLRADAEWAHGSGGDLVLVRGDGLRIVVEVTATTYWPDLRKKASKWAKLMAMRPLDVSGIAVLFLLAPPEDLDGRSLDTIGRDARKAVVRAIREQPGTTRDPTAARFAIAAWTDYFPARGRASPAFENLAAQRPTGHGDEDRFEPADLADWDTLPIARAARPALRAVIANATCLAGAFHTQPGQPPQVPLHKVPAARHRLDPEMLVPAPVRADRPHTVPIDAPRGAAGPIRPPDALADPLRATRPGPAG